MLSLSYLTRSLFFEFPSIFAIVPKVVLSNIIIFIISNILSYDKNTSSQSVLTQASLRRYFKISGFSMSWVNKLDQAYFLYSIIICI